MSETLSKTSLAQEIIPKEFVLNLGSLVRKLHDLPDAEYPCSQARALELFRKLKLAADDDDVKELIRDDREGAWSLLVACMRHAHTHGVPISDADLANKLDPVGLGRNDIRGNFMFLMHAIDAGGTVNIPNV